MMPGEILAGSLSKLEKIKYSVRNDNAAILYRCPCCQGFNMLSRRGQLITQKVDQGTEWRSTNAQWFTCGDCNIPVAIDEAYKVNRRKLSAEDLVRVEQAKAAQATRSRVYDIIARNTHIRTVDPVVITELYAKWFEKEDA